MTRPDATTWHDQPEDGLPQCETCPYCEKVVTDRCKNLTEAAPCRGNGREVFNPFEGQGPVFVVDEGSSFRDPVSGRIYCGRRVWNTLCGIINDPEDK
jgi:hypothetical protein